MTQAADEGFIAQIGDDSRKDRSPTHFFDDQLKTILLNFIQDISEESLLIVIDLFIVESSPI